jgi:dTMP kinase
MINTAKGKFIVIDWTDGSWKGTQTRILIKKLKNEWYNVEMADFPQYGQRSAMMVEDYLNWDFGTAQEVWPYRASVLYAVDRYAASFQIKKRLDEWKIVISNRYVSSNMWHQAGKIKDIKERDMFLTWLDNFEYWLFDIPKPDKNILLYMPTEIWQQLVDKKWHRDYVWGEKRDIHEADLQHLKDAAQAYRYVANKYNWTIIDSAPNNKLQTIEMIAEKIWNEIKNMI